MVGSWGEDPDDFFPPGRDWLRHTILVPVLSALKFQRSIFLCASFVWQGLVSFCEDHLPPLLINEESWDSAMRWLRWSKASKCQRRNSSTGLLNEASLHYLSALALGTLRDPVDCSPPGSSAHGIPQARILGLGCHALPQGIFLTQGLKLLLLSPALVGRFFFTNATWKDL